MRRAVRAGFALRISDLLCLMAPSIPEMFLRILLAFLAGFVVGWERESRGRPAGLRTTILTCVASAVAMLVSELLFTKTVEVLGAASVRADPARLGAGILTGIGFLGAGTILRHQDFIRGVTTAATLWFVTVLGLAFGSGQFLLGCIGTGTALVTLLALPSFEHGVRSDFYAMLTVTACLEALGEAELKQRVEARGAKVLRMRLDYDLERKQRSLACELRLKRPGALELSRQLVEELARYPGVLRVQWH